MDTSLEERRETWQEEPLVARQQSGGVTTLTLNRPKQYNVLSSAMLAALQQALDDAANDVNTRVVVLAGEGKAFCAGHDLREMQAHSDGETGAAWQRTLFNQCSRVMITIAEIPQPVIASVHGIATAAGCQLVAACDLAIAARSAKFATSGVNLGLFCSTPAVAVTRNISAKHAAELLFTGRFIDALTAERWGLISRCVDDDALETAVSEMATAIASKSAYAIRSGKALLRAQRNLNLTDAYAAASANMACDMQAEDAQMGIRAFLDKQPSPIWRNR
ncbi:MAG: enoyl-CoA hydratase [Casimicrobium sp.]